MHLHDVPLTLIPVNEWSEFDLPTLKDFDVRKSLGKHSILLNCTYQIYFQISIQLPSIKSLRSLCEKMKNIAPTVTACVSSHGDLSFVLETESAMISSRYTNLLLETNSKIQRNNYVDHVEISIIIGSKQLAMCVTSIQVSFYSNFGPVSQ